MRLNDQAGLTDAGRRRRRNEDAFVVDPPLFAVADGMGGAQAGEVASRLAAAAFREYHEADDLQGEERVEAIIQEANRRIFSRAQSDAGASGMGTTITAALVEGADGRVAVGHVGDSRAYRIGGEGLEQLTQDHSLVGDLIRSGRLTPEEADTHPQRSVITRALGTDPEVDVDTFVVEAAPGDVFLICSDGLTSMVGDDEILRLVRESGSLDQAARTLVRAANRQGGEDNITVVLFTLAEGEAEAIEETAPLAVVDGNGQGDTDELEDTLSGLEVPAAVQTQVVPPPDAEREAHWEPVGEKKPTAKKKRRRGRKIFFWVAALVFLALLLLTAFWGLANAHFVGAEGDGRVAVYQGLPYDLGGGVSLYRARYVSALRAAQLSADERSALFDHDLMSYDQARTRIAGLEAEALP